MQLFGFAHMLRLAHSEVELIPSLTAQVQGFNECFSKPLEIYV